MKRLAIINMFVLCASCSLMFDDKERLGPSPDGEPQDTATSSDLDMDTNTDISTDTDTDTDIDTGTDTDIETESETVSDTNTDTDTDADADTDIDVDTDSNLDSDTSTDLDIDSDTDTDADTGTDTDTDTMYHDGGPDTDLDGSDTESEVVDCGPPLDPPINGIIVGYSDETMIGSIVTFHCNDTFEMLGDPTRTCQDNGTWSGITSACGNVECEDPGDLENGVVNLPEGDTELGFGDQVSYTCDESHHIEGEDASTKTVTYTCDGTGDWNGEKPTCVEVDCGALTAPDNGDIVGYSDNTVFNSTVTFSCDATFGMQGEPTRVCQSDGTWSGMTPACGDVVCENPGGLPDGTVEFTDDYNYGSVVTYQCNDSHYISGEPATTKSVDYECLATGEWSGSKPTCAIVDCGALTPPTDGFIDSSTNGTLYESVVTFECDPNHDMQGSPTRTCQSNGTWSGATPACGAITCDDPGDLTNGEVDFTDGFNYDSDVTYTCINSHYITGQSASTKTVTYTCEADGDWSGVKPSCTLVNCNAPPTISHTNVANSSTTHGATATYSCDPGYAGSSSVFTCGDDGNWSGTAPSCTLVTCPTLTAPSNGNMIVSGYNLDDTATFSCIGNYSLVGNALLTCTASEWNYAAPTCKCNWLYRRQISVTGGSAGLQLLIVLPSDFDYDKARSDGRDIRFSTDASGNSFDLDYYIENWAEGKIWVRLEGGPSSIYMFYGNSTASSSQLGFDVMFPDYYHLLSTNDVTLTGVNTFDYVQVDGGAFLRVGVGEVLRINARKIVISADARIFGYGRGYVYNSAGNPGRGEDSTESAAGGGGGYGNVGGDGGTSDSFLVPGDGGTYYGGPLNSSIEMGSSGGNGDPPGYGGSGGGAVWLDAQEVIVSGLIENLGSSGGGDAANGGGGGSGGGILIAGNYVTVADSASLNVTGGNGGIPTVSLGCGGGGGGGGRIKIFHDTYSDISTQSGVFLADGGSGGAGEDYPGSDGSDGTIAQTESMDYPITAIVQSEVAM